MIHKKFIKQLSTDSFYNIIIATVLLTILSGIISELIAFERNDQGALIWLLIHVILSSGAGYRAWRLAQQDRQVLGVQLFIGFHLLLITLNFARAETLNTSHLYLYGYFIVISSTLLKPETSFGIWLTCLVLLVGALIYRNEPLSTLFATLVPMGINLFFAVAGFLTTIDWRDAVESASVLQLRAQRRRDELFAVQEQLRRANERQKSLYAQLLTSIEVGQRVATLVDRDVLLQEVAELIKTQLKFTYVGIFLLESSTFLEMHAQAGDHLDERQTQRRIFLSEKNILSITALKRQAVGMPDIRKAKFPVHPYLSSNAQSEITLPLLSVDLLYGVINIQSYGVNAFDEENLPILSLLANQIAIALRNVQLLNEAILARREAEQANEIKSRFLASMSHELRTPLNAILNFTGFVADGIFGEVNEEQVDALEKTLDSGSHLLSLINDILDLAKVEAGAMDMFIQEVDMNNLLNSTAAMAKGLLKNKPVRLSLDVEENLPHLMADKRRLRQILLNLVSNAVKYTKEGQITISAHHQEDILQISVQDTGIGVAPEDKDLIFESFHQAETGFNELGTGLGLPIAKHFVEAHGGEIWLESQVGIGTVFYVKLPLKTEKDQVSVL